MVLLSLYERHREELAEGFVDPETEAVKHKGWVPLATVFGNDKVPAELAAVLQQAVKRYRTLKQTADAKGWQALEAWAVRRNRWRRSAATRRSTPGSCYSGRPRG
jgi:hypothetical protein